MRFNAKILAQYYLSAVHLQPFPNEFIFSRRKIYFPKQLKGIIDSVGFNPFSDSELTDGTEYELHKEYNKDADKEQWLIQFGKSRNFIHVNFLNSVKLLYIHKRLFIQKEPLGLIGTILALLALILQAISTWKGK